MEMHGGSHPDTTPKLMLRYVSYVSAETTPSAMHGNCAHTVEHYGFVSGAYYLSLACSNLTSGSTLATHVLGQCWAALVWAQHDMAGGISAPRSRYGYTLPFGLLFPLS